MAPNIIFLSWVFFGAIDVFLFICVLAWNIGTCWTTSHCPTKKRSQWNLKIYTVVSGFFLRTQKLVECSVVKSKTHGFYMVSTYSVCLLDWTTYRPKFGHCVFTRSRGCKCGANSSSPPELILHWAKIFPWNGWFAWGDFQFMDESWHQSHKGPHLPNVVVKSPVVISVKVTSIAPPSSSSISFWYYVSSKNHLVSQWNMADHIPIHPVTIVHLCPRPSEKPKNFQHPPQPQVTYYKLLGEIDDK